MKNWFVLAVLLIVGCGDDVTTQTVGDCSERSTDEAQAPFVADAGCQPQEIVETTLPISGMGTMIAICTDCDVSGCDGLGVPCAAYGTTCDFGGEPGVCVACCNGIVGELHCKPVDY